MRLIDQLPTLIRLPVRGLISVTLFAIAAGLFIGFGYLLVALATLIYNAIGWEIFKWILIVLATLVVLTWFGTMTDD